MKHPSWRFAAVVLAVLTAVDAVAENDARLDMPKPTVAVVGADRVRAECGRGSLGGCTTFRDFMLTCNCVTSASKGWRPSVIISAVPHIYLTKFSFLEHEMLHIADFRRLIKLHTGALESNDFDSKFECDRYARAASAAFPDTMRRIARVSMGLRDGTVGDVSEDHLFVVKAEIVPKFMDDRIPDLAHGGSSVASDPQNRTAEDSYLVW